MRADVVALARGWIGTPYVHQASVQGAGSDCLGLIRGIWRELYGAEPCVVPPYTPDWSEPSHDEVLVRAARLWLIEKPLDEEAPGDVLVFRMRAGAVAKHLGIAAEIGSRATFIHAYSGHHIVESPFPVPWRRRLAGRFSFPEQANT
jgi:NlpC/P60 family putative phage cell wall peptidase